MEARTITKHVAILTDAVPLICFNIISLKLMIHVNIAMRYKIMFLLKDIKVLVFISWYMFGDRKKKLENEWGLGSLVI